MAKKLKLGISVDLVHLEALAKRKNYGFVIGAMCLGSLGISVWLGLDGANRLSHVVMERASYEPGNMVRTVPRHSSQLTVV